MAKKKENTEELQTAQELEQPVIDANNVSDTESNEQVEEKNGNGNFIVAPELVNDMTVVKKEPMTENISVVIPFFKSVRDEQELVCSLRSLQKHLRDDINIVIIGDTLTGETALQGVELLPLAPNGNAQLDLLEVLKMAVASESVSDSFILVEPGMYLVDDIKLSHIEIPKHNGRINPNRYDGYMRALMSETLHLLEKVLRSAALFDYASRCPVMLEKSKLVELFEEVPDVLSGKYHVLTVYFNSFGFHPLELDFKTDCWVLPVVSVKPDIKIVESMLTGKCFLYVSPQTESAELDEHICSAFPDKSIYEVGS